MAQSLADSAAADAAPLQAAAADQLNPAEAADLDPHLSALQKAGVGQCQWLWLGQRVKHGVPAAAAAPAAACLMQLPALLVVPAAAAQQLPERPLAWTCAALPQVEQPAEHKPHG